MSVRQLSNPYSTGGGGVNFEACVQAMFVTLMLTGGVAPCLPPWPITKIKLQGRVDGFDMDDLIVYVEDPITNQTRKLIAQIKHTIRITKGDRIFSEVMQAAWNDFNNLDIFDPNKDTIALITGPLNKTDTNDAVWLLDQARHTSEAEEFFRHVMQTHFSSAGKRAKLKAFQKQLEKANSSCEVAERRLYSFLRRFHLLGCDLGRESGITLSLLHSHMSQFQFVVPPPSIWGRIVTTVQNWNQDAGTITPENIPDDLRQDFEQPERLTFPTEFLPVRSHPEEPDWNQHPLASALVVANLLGAWNEENEADLDVIRQLHSS